MNPNQMKYHHIDVQDSPCIQKPMGITCPEEDMTIPLHKSGIIVCADTSSPKKRQLEDFLWIVLTSPHEWDPHSVLFPKGSHSEEEEYLFTCIAEIRVDALRRKVHDTEMETGIRNTVHEPSFITMRLVSQVRIDDAKVSDATRITDIDKGVFEVQRQGIPSHRTFTSK